MKVAGKTVIVTGAASGIGLGLATRFKAEGATVVMSDVNESELARAATALSCPFLACDVADEAAVERLVARAEGEHGPVELYCSNAGYAQFGRYDARFIGAAPNAHWEACWAINVMAHVYAARALVPRMVRRGRGYFLITSSAAGLLSQPGNPAYAVTKHAAIAFAESLAIAHRDQGIGVSVLAPQAVDTPMLREADQSLAAADGVMSTEELAGRVVEGLCRERFLILPHPEVGTYFKRKADDYERWLAGMVKLNRRLHGPADAAGAA